VLAAVPLMPSKLPQLVVDVVRPPPTTPVKSDPHQPQGRDSVFFLINNMYMF
jgi:hypothetical protein